MRLWNQGVFGEEGFLWAGSSKLPVVNYEIEV